MEYFERWIISEYCYLKCFQILSVTLNNKRNETFVQVVAKPTFQVLGYGIVWKMEYSKLWNIIKYGIFGKRQRKLK